MKLDDDVDLIKQSFYNLITIIHEAMTGALIFLNIDSTKKLLHYFVKQLSSFIKNA